MGMISNVQEKELDLENSVLIVKVYNLILVLHIDVICYSISSSLSDGQVLFPVKAGSAFFALVTSKQRD